MLDVIRQNVRHPYIQALLGMVILVFILFFGWSASTQRPNYMAKVNGDTISYREYQRVYEGLSKIYQEAFGSEASPEKMRQLGLNRRALDQLIEQALLVQEAGHRSIKVTKADVQAAIAEVSAFKNQGGGFELKRYELVLQQNRLTPAEYEEMKEREILLDKIQTSIRAEAKVTDADVRAEYDARNTKIDLEFVSFDPATLTGAVTVADKDLRAAYEAQKESYRTPEKRIARYALFAAESHAAAGKVTDEEIAREYGAGGGGQSLDQAKPAIEAALRKRKALEAAYKDADQTLSALEDRKETWESIGKQATVNSSAPVARGSAVEGVDKGRELANLLFTLEPQKPGNLLESDKGTYLVAVDKVLPSAIPPFEEVKARVEAKYRETESKKLAEKKATEFLEAAKKSGWDAAVKAAGSKSATTGVAAKKGAPPANLAWTPELRDAAFALTTVGALGSKPYPVQGKVYALRLASRTPADPVGFAAQKDKLAAELLPAKQNDLLQEKIKKLKAAAKIKINEELLM